MRTPLTAYRPGDMAARAPLSSALLDDYRRWLFEVGFVQDAAQQFALEAQHLSEERLTSERLRVFRLLAERRVQCGNLDLEHRSGGFRLQDRQAPEQKSDKIEGGEALCDGGERHLVLFHADSSPFADWPRGPVELYRLYHSWCSQ